MKAEWQALKTVIDHLVITANSGEAGTGYAARRSSSLVARIGTPKGCVYWAINESGMGPMIPVAAIDSEREARAGEQNGRSARFLKNLRGVRRVAATISRRALRVACLHCA